MLKSKKNTVKARTNKAITNGTVIIKAGSFVYENNWINFKGIVFNVDNYITNALVPPRTRFFNNRNYAFYLIIGLDKNGELTYLEGNQVEFTSIKSIPIPNTYKIIPLVGIILIQDGSRNLNNGYKPLNDSNVIFFSGAGNVLDKNQKGPQGTDSSMYGSTGLMGLTGIEGSQGFKGDLGHTGMKGPSIPGDQGATGFKGMTGINWNIHIPFEDFL
jgi:hypothetical protein